MNRLFLFLILVCLSPALLTLSCGRPLNKTESNQPDGTEVATQRFIRPEPVSHDYVGSEACRRCHGEIMKEYESHPMSISMSVTKDFSVERYPTQTPIDAGKRSTWTASRENGDVFHSEEVKSSDGKQLFSHREKIDYTCGSGTNGCSYFVFDEGRLYQSPITWFTDSKKWDISPGYQIPNHLRFERMAGEGCLACHAGRMSPVSFDRSTFDVAQPFPELAIGCERCHGPGKEHIEFHDSSRVDQQAKDPIVNPDHLSPELREAVCYQCHLPGAPRVPRYGRTDFDFRPGMHISDIWITFLETAKADGDKFEAVSQVEQMQLSECFIQSKGELGCTSCHDPHRSPAPESRIEFYRDSCIQCHSVEPDNVESQKAETLQAACGLALEDRKKESPEDSCIHCHMPTMNAADITHLSQTNHRVHIPGDDFRAPLPTSGDFRVWNDKEVPKHAIERAKTIAMAAPAFIDKNIALADNALKGLDSFDPPAEDDLALNESLAQLYLVKGKSKQAFEIWKRLLEKHPKDQFLLDQMSSAYYASGRFEEAYPLYQRLFEVNRRRPSLLVRYLDVCNRLAKIDEGIKVATRILELEPGIAYVHQWLANAYQRKNNAEKSSYHRQMANQLSKNQ